MTKLSAPFHNRATWRRGCRCSQCRRDVREAARADWAVRQLRRGRQPAYRVSTAPVVRHLDHLQAAGLTSREVARRAGVASGTLSRARRRALMSNLTATAILTVLP